MAEQNANFARLAKRSRPYVPFTFHKREDEEVATEAVLVVLSESEMQECFAEAQKFADAKTREKTGDATNHSSKFGWAEVYEDEKIVQVMTLAMREVGYPKEDLRFVPNPKMLRDALNSDELGVLNRAYQNLRADSGPIISQVSSDDAEAWIQALMEGGKRSPLSRLSSEGLTDLVMHLVARLKSSSTTSGLSGSPADVSSEKQENGSPSSAEAT